MLTRPPTESDLERLYWELAQVGAPSVAKQQPSSYSPSYGCDRSWLWSSPKRHPERESVRGPAPRENQEV